MRDQTQNNIFEYGGYNVRKERALPAVEVLAPVGNREMFDAAVAAKADAIYMAGKSFGARAYAKNFDEQQIQEVIDLAHWNGMRVYITVNTLIKENEMEVALAQVDELFQAGADAIIVQDLGLIKAVHERLPDLPLHGSTQLSVTSVEGAKRMQALGLSRIVIGREVSVEEAKRIVDETDLEVEAFVHGSLCVSVSGQCYMSSFAGGRSGNRGRCAQPCRKTYTIVNQNGKVVGEKDTYLSPRDLATIDQIDQLVEAGICSVKIEGRMKKPEYVFATVRAYRAAIDDTLTEQLVRDMKLTTNRPFTEGFLFHDFGIDYLFRERDLSGEPIGRIEHVSSKKAIRPVLRLERALAVGDIVTVESDKHRFPLTSTSQFQAGDVWDLSKYPDLKRGSTAILIHSENARNLLQEVLQAEGKKQPLSIQAEIYAGAPIRIVGRCLGYVKEAVGEVAQPAKNAPMTADDLKKSLEKVGNTPFYIERIDVFTDASSFVPKSVLNQLRRTVTDALFEEIVRAYRRKLPQESNTAAIGDTEDAATLVEASAHGEASAYQLALETSSEPSAYPKEALRKVSRVYLRGHVDVHSWFAHREATAGTYELCYQGPRLLESTGFSNISEQLDQLLAQGICFDGFRVQSVDDWQFYKEWNETRKQNVRLYGAHTMNVTNRLSFATLQSDLDTIAVSQELTTQEIQDLRISTATLPTAETIVFGRLAGMLLKHCPAAAIRGCVDDSKCTTCAFRKNHVLVDGFGKREFFRQDGETEILLPDTIDIRGRDELLRDTGITHLLIVDHMEDEIPAVIEDWTGYLENGRWRNKREKAFLGHFVEGME